MNLFYVSKDGTSQKLGDIVEVKEISEPDTSEEVSKINLGNDEGLTLTINLRRLSKKVWAKIFQMQRYELTEWMFPKKKKRGTARRLRRRKGDADE